MAKKKFSQVPYNRQHLRNIVAQGLRVREAFLRAANTAGIIGEGITPADPDAEFYLKDYPAANARMEDTLTQLHDELVDVVQSGNATEWALSNAKNDALVNSILNGESAARMAESGLLSHNMDALAAFNGRKVGGMSLSERVWSYVGQTRQEFELALGLGIATGRSAGQLSRDIRAALNNPDMLFRRVRDKHGELRLSKAAKAYHPGRGVYRSSYKNALRMAATENNMAYRKSDHERWMQNKYVIGIEIKPSINNHPVEDICDELAGKYPKEFEWSGWHPFCRCFATPILADDKQRLDYMRARLEGEDVSNWEFDGAVKEMPEGWNKWVEANEERIAKAKSMPYFIKDNFKGGKIEGGVKWAKEIKPSISILERAEARHAARTQAEIDDIQKRWNRRKEQYEKRERYERLKARWRVGDYGTYSTNKVAQKINLDDLYDGIERDFSEYGVKIDYAKIKISETTPNKVGIMLTADSNLMERVFVMNEEGEIIVYHELLSINKPLQGKGLSKKLFKTMYNQYEASGVKQIKLYANIDVGGYAWAKYNFYAEDYYEAMDAVKAISNKEFSKLAAEKVDIWYKQNNIDKGSPFPMRIIAEMDEGKEALMGTSWNGVMNLNDKEQVDVMKRYLGL